MEPLGDSGSAQPASAGGRRARRRIAWVLVVAALVVGVVVFVGQKSVEPARMAELVALPRPNSGEFTSEAAELRKGEIYANKPTGPVADWLAPENGTGIQLHLTASDGIIVEDSWIFPDESWTNKLHELFENFTGRSGRDKNQERRRCTLGEFEVMLVFATLYNEPATIVVTSERPLSESKVFPQLLELMFKPSCQIYYVPSGR
jgi:hypothetical protein